MSNAPIRVLYVDDDPLDRAMVRAALERNSRQFVVTEASSFEVFCELLDQAAHDIVLSDHGVLGFEGLDIIDAVKRRDPLMQVIVVTCTGSEELAVEAMKRGAADYVIKRPPQLQRLPSAIATVLESTRQRKERAEMFAALRASEYAQREAAETLSTVLHALPAHIALLDQAGTIRLVNEAWQRFSQPNVFHGESFGVGMNYIELCEWATEECGEDARRAAAGMRQVIAGEAPLFSLEYAGHGQDEQRWFRMMVTPLHSHGHGAVVMHIDVTERRVAEERLRESEQLHRVTLSSLAEAVFITNDEGRFAYVCENVRVIFGFSRDEAMQIGSIFDLLGSHDLIDPRLVHSLGRIDNLEHEICAKNGSRHVVLVNVSHVDIGGGTLLFTCRDITDRKRAEMALQESEQRYRLLAEHSTDIISKHTPDGTCLYASPAALRLLGFQPEQLLGRSAYELIHLDDRPGLEEFYTAISNGQSRTSLYRIRRADGSYTWFETTSQCIGLEGDDEREVICVSRDVTLRKETEDLARRQQAELAHIARLSSMGEMATGLAHELNQPLTVISHYADACTQTIESDEDFRPEQIMNWTKRISEQAHQAGEIIRRIKIFGRKSEPHRSVTACEEVIREAVELTAMDAAMHGCRVRVSLAENLPCLDVDKVQIQQVLVNLLRNAFEALDSSGAEDRLVEVVAARENGTQVQVFVKDRGAGVPEECLEEVFESFVTGKPHGTGMGLPISRSIVVNHGGRLWAVNNPEGGISFQFTLPIASGATCDDV